MAMGRKEKLEYVRQGLKSFAKLERAATDEVGWIAFKLSIGRKTAEKLIAAARAEESGKA